MKYYTKEVCKIMKIALIGFLVITIITLIKYKPVYAVTLSGETIGYIADREDIESKINNYINEKDDNIAFRVTNDLPKFDLMLVSRANKNTPEDLVFDEVKSSIVTTYQTYAITIDGEVKARVSSEEEAMQIIEEMKGSIPAELEMKLGIVTDYTNDAVIPTKEAAVASINEIKTQKETDYNNQKAAEAKEAAIASTTKVAASGKISGMQLSIPVKGMISSRYGSRSSRRSSLHTGLDIATSQGTGIRPIASGTVTYADEKGTYGNLVIVNHGNGIESYYAHCNALYVNVGDTVDTNSTIASVGSTGNSTGPHLHLEIRVNGSPVNPQQYLYK